MKFNGRKKPFSLLSFSARSSVWDSLGFSILSTATPVGLASSLTSRSTVKVDIKDFYYLFGSVTFCQRRMLKWSSNIKGVKPWPKVSSLVFRF